MLEVRGHYVRRQIVAFFCVAPFTLVLLYSAMAFGLLFMSGFVSTFTSLVFLPLLFLWFYPPLLPLVNRPMFLKCLQISILVAALFGIFLFFWRPYTGTWIQIPYLTVNADDVGDFASTKNIARGSFFKLISTYNNGNLYGAATLIVLRLYEQITPSRWQRWVLYIALFLTLSRTVWAGLVFDLILSLIALLIAQRKRFPVVRLGRVAWAVAILLVFVPVYLVLSNLLGVQQSHGFLLDPTLGGRTAQFTRIGLASFFPSTVSTFFFTEITYLSAINLYGYIGFVTITILLLSPLVVLLFDRRALQDPYRRAAFKGLLLYALISTSDGAINFIPIMAFYWFTYMVFLFGMPGSELDAEGSQSVHAVRSSQQLCTS
ncbi:MAG: hypothetical protein ACRYGF_06420 [Janthinobacterium lividum]